LEFGREPFSGPGSIYRDWKEEICQAEVIQLHWVGRYLDYPSFFSALTPHQKVFWRLSDMNSFTGGCHYDEGCGRFQFECGHCPQLQRPWEQDFSHQGLALKRKVFSGLPSEQLQFVAASRWLLALVKNSPLTSRFPAHLLPLGVNTEVFYDPGPEKRREIRVQMGLPPNQKILLAGAGSLAVMRKGSAMLKETLQKLHAKDNFHLITLGDEPLSGFGRMEYHHLGKISEPSKLASIYAAADLLLFFPSQENLANQLMESLACGTPAVATEVGGNPEIVDPGETGWLVPLGNPGEAATTVERHFSRHPDALRKMRRQCRQKAEKDFCEVKQIRAYRDLYEASCSTSCQNVTSLPRSTKIVPEASAGRLGPRWVVRP